MEWPISGSRVDFIGIGPDIRAEDIVINQIPFRKLSDADLDRLEREPGEIVVTRDNHEPMVILPQSELEGLKETFYLLSNPANTKHLLDSIAEINAGKGIERESIDP